MFFHQIQAIKFQRALFQAKYSFPLWLQGTKGYTSQKTFQHALQLSPYLAYNSESFENTIALQKQYCSWVGKHFCTKNLVGTFIRLLIYRILFLLSWIQSGSRWILEFLLIFILYFTFWREKKMLMCRWYVLILLKRVSIRVIVKKVRIQQILIPGKSEINPTGHGWD